MIATRWIAAVTVVAACLGGTTAAEAKHRKPIKQTYDLTLPVPWAVEDTSGSHCTSATAGVSKDERKLALASSGKLSVELTDVVGDWIIEVYDGKGRMVGMASTFGSTSAKMSVRNKARTAQTWRIAICNYAGGPHGTVTLTYVFD